MSARPVAASVRRLVTFLTCGAALALASCADDRQEAGQGACVRSHREWSWTTPTPRLSVVCDERKSSNEVSL